MGDIIHTKAPAKLVFLPRLEALRGLAAVAVVGYHAVNDEVVTGMAPVVLFFVLSGFVLARSLENNPDSIAFFRSRILRLFPAAAATVLLLSALYWQFGFFLGYRASFDILNILLNALLIRSDINSVMWSLTVECVAAPLILGSFFLYKARGAVPLIILSVALFGLSFYGPYVHLLGGFTSLAPFYAFITGMLLHFLAAKAAIRRDAALFPVTFLAILIWCGLRKQTSLVICLESICAGGVIFLIATNAAERLFSFLDWYFVRFLGRISYSFYLLHPIGIALALRSAPESTAALIFIFAIAYTIPMAWLSWRFIERPFMVRRRSKDADDVIANDRRLHDGVRIAATGVIDRYSRRIRRGAR
jgi:peptidoglycan/LPS O-acetylase OafA/YrhL